MFRINRSLFLLLPVIAVASCQEKQEAPAEAPRPVLSVVVGETPADALRLTGTVESRIQTDLGFRVLGRIIARNVDVADLVKKGDVVASIDPLALELSVKSAQSDLSNAEAQLANAVTTEQRQRVLAEARSGTEAALEEAEQATRTANAAVAKARANLDKAEEQLGYTQLHAEFDGVVTATSGEIGQVVSAGQTVVTIARPEVRDVVIDVPQFAAQRLQIGSTFDIALQLDPNIRTTGVVREIAPEAETATRTRRTKISLQDAPPTFRLGSVVTASATAASEPKIMLPSSALLKTGDGWSVWVVNTETATVTLRPVTIDGEPVDGGTVRIAGGVKPGERVASAGVHKLKDGQAIRIDQEVRP